MEAGWKNLGTHYQMTKDNRWKTKVDANITREDNGMVHASLKEGILGRQVSATFFAPAPSDDVILSKLAKG